MLPVTGGAGGVFSSTRDAKRLDLRVVLALNHIVVT